MWWLSKDKGKDSDKVKINSGNREYDKTNKDNSDKEYKGNKNKDNDYINDNKEHIK